ncbi:glycosyltransferase family 2 protein [Clostridium sp. YIM B02515]|uniref:Glycosyltransferase family 2 protein n=1 Tax=Clostridium rhizosphaerae TaxID=2803861 RepID=A0ABS1TA51_9CLOT|nr:glycosyltransferase family 2 protein [Clostridium rhizosphaerae]MBL4935541.1 glycosyltransferase family 2 protein [Clostridium rhizosphaerae]
MKTLVIIPAYNEQDTIYNVVTQVKNCGLKVDVLVINDGSNDCTSQKAVQAGAEVIDLPVNVGIGGAVQTGYLYALYKDYDIAVQIDGDGQHNPKYLNKLIQPLIDDKADMVIGSRFLEETGYTPSFFRSIGIRYFSRLVSHITHKPIFDTTSGFRAINRKTIELFAKYYPSDYPEVETIVYCSSRGIRISEVPVCMNYRQGGKSSITPIKSIYYMIKVTLSIVL